MSRRNVAPLPQAAAQANGADPCTALRHRLSVAIAV